MNLFQKTTLVTARIVALIFILLAQANQNLKAVEETALKIIRASPADPNLLKNPDFESGETSPTSWNKYESGFVYTKSGGKNNSSAIICKNDSPSARSGANQTIILNQKEPLPIIARGWSKAENVSGSPDNNYSIYVDLIYDDGTPLWGQTANFTCGTHDWEVQEVIIMPQKPVRQLTVYCLFRHHTGTVWFDDISVSEIKPQAGAFLWQGRPVTAGKTLLNEQPARTYSTKDGLKLSFAGDAVKLQIDDEEFPQKTLERKQMDSLPSGWMAYDAATDSDIYAFSDKECKPLNLKLVYEIKEQASHLEITGKITDLTKKDRAITLTFALPVDAEGWQWWDDIRRGRTISGKIEYSNTSTVRCGLTGTMSVYPLCAINNNKYGIALAIDMSKPAVYRLIYHAGLKQLLIAYDFGLVPDTKNFPSSAEFKFIIYRFNPAKGFRSALKKYMEIFPDYFVVRSKEQGIWMPFTDVSTVEGWQDFGFKYHEGNNNVPFDDANGILSFRYTEPMTWWMPMQKDLPRTAETAIRIRDSLLESKKQDEKIAAQVSVNCAMYDINGKPYLLFLDTPWCNGAVWSLNPNPYLKQKPNFADWHWNDALKERLYGKNSKGILDGEYLDSLEGYVTADINFRREHFTDTTVPLTFSTTAKRPGLFKGLAVFEFTKWICDDVHSMGKQTFANGVPYRFTFLCPWLDIMGTETDWNRNGKWNPVPDSTMCLWRSMCGAKPYLILMNTIYDNFTTNLVEKYFQRCAFYGFYPSMFSHNASENPYWQNPKWYNRDRLLFKKYIPIIKRIAETGWNPVTCAESENPSVFIEQFGRETDSVFFITAFNSAGSTQQTIIKLPDSLKTPIAITELISGNSIKPEKSNKWNLTLLPEQVAVFEIKF
jgi:hypothetical protein